MSTREDILTLRIGGDDFALPLKDVSHILEVDKINILPKAKSPAIGIISTRGEAVVVVDVETITQTKDANQANTYHHRDKCSGKIIILKDNKLRLGLYIGSIAPSFLYKDDDGTTSSVEEPRKESLEIDWKKLYRDVDILLKEKIDE